MARSSRYCAPYRRRKEGKTDYDARRALILSGRPRVVVRSSLKNVIVQMVTARPEGDRLVISAHSRELATKYGWKASRGNLPTAYLTGLLCGLKAKSHGLREAIPDIGLHSPSKGARAFAVLKGLLDAGIHVPCSEEKLPDEKRLKGEHIAEYAKSLSSNAEEYQARFSKYIEQKLAPEDVTENLAEVKKEILVAFKSGGRKNETSKSQRI
jgi:large subunit ribosomal protein L18